MKQVEGIKAEVDRQRSHGRVLLIVTLVLGIVIGAVATFIGYICPFNTENLGESAFAGLFLFLTTWKQYFFILLTALSVSLALALPYPACEIMISLKHNIPAQNTNYRISIIEFV